METCKVWGISGQIGAGKSTIGNLLVEAVGALNIEVDSLAHSLLKTDDIRASLIEAFGGQILDKSGSIDKKILGKIAFSSKENIAKLNRIMHPPMIEAVKKTVAEEKKSGKPLILVNAALLFTMGLDKLCDFVIYLTADTQTRLQRIIASRKITVEQAKHRLWAQDSLPFKLENSVVYDNSGDMSTLKKWVFEFLLPKLKTQT